MANGKETAATRQARLEEWMKYHDEKHDGAEETLKDIDGKLDTLVENQIKLTSDFEAHVKADEVAAQNTRGSINRLYVLGGTAATIFTSVILFLLNNEFQLIAKVSGG